MSQAKIEKSGGSLVSCPTCRAKLKAQPNDVFRCPNCQDAFFAQSKTRYVRKKQECAVNSSVCPKEKKAQKREKWRKILLSPTLASKTLSKRLAYIAVVTALVVVCNMFFEFKLAETQFSFTIVVSAVAGIVIGPIFGFVACFLGDLVGFLYHSAGFAYLPWIGVSMGVTALLAGFIVGGVRVKKGWLLYVKLFIVSLLTFLICTVAINTTAFWILYSKVDYWTYFVGRIFIQGQIWNTVFNTALLFIVVPALKNVKALKIYVN